MSWKKTKLEGDPLLVIGLRNEQREIEGFRINLDKDVNPDLERVAKDTLDWMRNREPVAYTPYVDPEEGEYLTIATKSLPTSGGSSASKGGGQTEKEETAAIVALVRDADVLPEMGAGQLIKRLESDFYLQAICLKDGPDRIGFITKAKRQQVMKRSIIPLGKSDTNDRLKRITLPELLLESDVHAIISPGEIAILNRTQFQFLVSDTPLISSHVPAQVQRIAKAFKGRGIELSGETQAAIQTTAMSSVRVAKRLEAFAERIEVVNIALISSGKGFADQELVASDFVNSKGEIACELGRVPELLDALEGRFFDDAFSTEKRRADRFRRR